MGQSRALGPTCSPSYTSAWKSCIARSTDWTKMSNGGRSQPHAHHLAQRDELAVFAPAEDERLLHRVHRGVLHEAARRNKRAGRVGGAVTVRGGGR